MNILSPNPADCFRLLIRPSPDPRESLAGYLLRVAEVNCLRHVQELREFLGAYTTYPSPPSLIPQFGIYDLELLGKELDLPASHLAAIAKPLDVRVGKFRKFRHQGKLWPLGMLRDKHRAWCPLCLKEAHIQQASWDWRLQTACPRHRVLLVDRCQSCQRHVSWRCSSLRHCVCGYPLADAPTLPVDPAWQPIAVNDLPPNQLMRYLTLVLLVLEGGQPDLARLTAADNEQVHRATLGVTNSLLQSAAAFQRAVINLVEKRYIAYPSLGPRYAVASLLHGLGLCANFDAKLESIANHWLHTVHPIPVVNNYSPNNEAPALSIATVATTLNVSSHIIKTLLRKEILTFVTDNYLAHRKRIDKQEVIDGKSVARLLRRLSSLNESVPNGKIVRFDHYGIDHAKRLDLLNEIDGEYIRIATFNITVGLPSLALSKTLRTTGERSSSLSIRKSAEFLEIYPDAIYRLIKARLLTARGLDERRACIEIDELTKFRENHIFTHEIARKLMCNPTNIADRIISIGIIPIHGPAIDGGLTYAFRRSDITDEVLLKINDCSTYKSRTGRGRKIAKPTNTQLSTDQETFTTLELSVKTGVSIATIQHEAKYGCLSEAVINMTSSKKSFQFHSRAIGILALLSESHKWTIKKRKPK